MHDNGTCSEPRQGTHMLTTLAYINEDSLAIAQSQSPSDMEPIKILPLLLVIAAGAAMEGTEQPRTRWIKVKRNTEGAPATGKKAQYWCSRILV